MASALFLSKTISHKKNISDKIIDAIYRVYPPLLSRVLTMKKTVVGIAILFLIIVLFTFSKLGGEFIPTLDEGDITANVIIASESTLSQEVSHH